MPIIQLPNGKTAQFPDSMQPGDIEAVLRQQFPSAEMMGSLIGAAPLPAPPPPLGPVLEDMQGALIGAVPSRQQLMFEPRDLLPAGIRMAGQVAPIPGSGALSEYVARGAEYAMGDRPLEDLAMSTDLTKAMASKEILARLVPGGSSALTGAARGAVIGPLAATTQAILEENRLPTKTELTVNTLLGAVLGGGSGKLQQVLKDRAQRTQLASELSRQLGEKVESSPQGITAAVQKIIASRAPADIETPAFARGAPQPFEPLDPAQRAFLRAQQFAATTENEAQRAAMAPTYAGGLGYDPVVAREASQATDAADLAQRAQSYAGEAPYLDTPAVQAIDSRLSAPGGLSNPSQGGFVSPQLLTGLGRSAVDATAGAFVGSRIGDTEEERRKNMMIGAAVGASARPTAAMVKWLLRGVGPQVTRAVIDTPGAASLPPNILTDANVVTTEGVKQIAAFAQSSASKTEDRLFKQLAQSFVSGELEPGEIINVLQRRGQTLPEFILESKDAFLGYRDTVSGAARVLGRLSYMRRQLNALAGQGNQQAQEALQALGGPITPSEAFWGRLSDGVNTIVGTWRGSMTAQLATTMRNIVSQTGASAIDAMDAVVAGDPQYAGNLLRAETQRVGEGLEAIGRFITALPQKADKLERVFAANPIAARRILGNPAAEAALGQYTGALNFANSIQERFFRKSILDATIRTWANAAGQDVQQVLANPAMIPQEVIEKGVERALKVTFAAQPKSQFFKNYLLAYKFFPPLYAINPYPRFQANAVRFLVDHSPAGLLRIPFGSVPTRQAVAEAMTGTVLMGSAMALRYSQNAGEHWFTLKTDDDSRADIKPYNPFAGYLFGAELLKNYVLNDGKEITMSPKDLALGLQAMSLRGGAGYSLLDVLSGSEDITNIPRIAKVVAGNLLAGFTVPLRQVKDFIAGFQDEAGPEGVYRDTRENPLLGPILANVPYLSRSLPESPNPLDNLPQHAEHPLIRQLTGVNVQDLNPVEQAVARLGIESKSIYPKTGVDAVNREITATMGPVQEQINTPLVQNPRFQQLPDFAQRRLLENQIRRVRGAATSAVYQRTPQTRAQVLRKRLENPQSLREDLLARKLGILR